MSLFLTDDEIVELTGYKFRERQKKALAELGVEFKIRPADGFPLVNRAAFEAQDKPRRRKEPDFKALERFG